MRNVTRRSAATSGETTAGVCGPPPRPCAAAGACAGVGVAVGVGVGVGVDGACALNAMADVRKIAAICACIRRAYHRNCAVLGKTGTAVIIRKKLRLSPFSWPYKKPAGCDPMTAGGWTVMEGGCRSRPSKSVWEAFSEGNASAVSCSGPRKEEVVGERFHRQFLSHDIATLMPRCDGPGIAAARR